MLGFELDFWDYATFATAALAGFAGVLICIWIAGLPGRIAIARKHPEAEAVNIMGYAGLLPTWCRGSRRSSGRSSRPTSSTSGDSRRKRRTRSMKNRAPEGDADDDSTDGPRSPRVSVPDTDGEAKGTMLFGFVLLFGYGSSYGWCSSSTGG